MSRLPMIAFSLLLLLSMSACETTQSGRSGDDDPVVVDQDNPKADGQPHQVNLSNVGKGDKDASGDSVERKGGEGNGDASGEHGSNGSEKVDSRDSVGEMDVVKGEGNQNESGSSDLSEKSEGDEGSVNAEQTGDDSSDVSSENSDEGKEGEPNAEVTYLQALAELEQVAVKTGKPEAMLTFIFALIQDTTASQGDSLVLAETLLDQMEEEGKADSFTLTGLRAMLLDRMNEAKECAETLEEAMRIQYGNVGIELTEVFFSDGFDRNRREYTRRTLSDGEADRRYTLGSSIYVAYSFRFLKGEFLDERDLWRYHFEGSLELLYKKGPRIGERVDGTTKMNFTMPNGSYLTSSPPEEEQKAHMSGFRIPRQLDFGEYTLRITLTDINRPGWTAERELDLLVVSQQDLME